MGFAINLRSDLRRMSDTELTALLARCWERHDAAKALASSFKLIASYRGFIRHPTAYPLISVLRVGSAFTWSMGLAVGFGFEGAISPPYRAIMKMHLALCDIADINDELARRNGRRTPGGV